MSSKTAYIVLFRGVGGKTQLPVKRLRESLRAAGFSDVSTYINSGNAVLSSPLPTAAVASRIGDLVKKAFSFEKSIILRNAAEWSELIAHNPFPHAAGKPTTLHAFVLESPPAESAVDALMEKATGTERFEVKGKTLYLHAPDGLGRSKFAARIEPTLKVVMTARNWRTVLALEALAKAI